MAFSKDFSIIENNNIQSSPFLIDLKLAIKTYYNKFYGQLSFVPRFNIVSNSNISNHYSNNGYSLSLGRKFQLFDDFIFEFSVGYLHQVMNINIYETDSGNILDSNNISLADGKNLLNLNKIRMECVLSWGLKQSTICLFLCFMI
ncbi:MAG: hypothetical protein GX879_07165 [Bacteroidales bacterium]|nr:hypothetical protein [Bacteroidales bacterium]